MSAHCPKCGADITYPADTWPVGTCVPCDLTAKNEDLRKQLTLAEKVLSNIALEDRASLAKRYFEKKVETQIVEEAEYEVTATCKVVIGFSPIPRETPLTEEDAIQNAIGTVTRNVWQELDDEGWSVQYVARRLP